MSVAFNKVFQEVALMLGAVVGADAASSDTNYAATLDDATLIGPDFPKTAIKDAVVATLSEIVNAICETPHHPERGLFVTNATVNSGDPLPTVTPLTNKPVIGVIGRVKDGSTGNVCLPVDADRVRSYNQFKSTLYNGLNISWYAVVGNKIELTCSSATIEICFFERPTDFSGNIPVRDIHERALICGAVALLAGKEGMYAALGQQCQAEYLRHLQEIRALGAPEWSGLAQASPSAT